jgi:hypothetical protein
MKTVEKINLSIPEKALAQCGPVFGGAPPSPKYCLLTVLPQERFFFLPPFLLLEVIVRSEKDLLEVLRWSIAIMFFLFFEDLSRQALPAVCWFLLVFFGVRTARIGSERMCIDDVFAFGVVWGVVHLFRERKSFFFLFFFFFFSNSLIATRSIDFAAVRVSCTGSLFRTPFILGIQSNG